MERLTWRRSDDAVCPRVPKGTSNEYIMGEFTQKVYDRLNEYENTGLTPNEIICMKFKLYCLEHGVGQNAQNNN